MNVGVIGAGLAAASAVYVIDATVPGATVTVLEKSGGVCGRAATRRHQDSCYDYGANYLKDDDPRVVELVTEELDTDGLVTIDEPVYVFDEDGKVSNGRDSDERKWSYRSGITQLAKRLFETTDATVHRHTRIEGISRDDGEWTLLDSSGKKWGPFDVLLCNPPAPQTAELLRRAEWDAPIRDTLVSAIEEVSYRAIWTAVLGYEFELDVPYYALVNSAKNHDVGWISREECKPGHVPDGESLLIVQASHEWSVSHSERSPTENIAALAAMTSEIIDDERLRSPSWTDHQAWQYALPEAGVALGPLTSVESAGLYCVGDWVAGAARMHAAIRNGLDTSERIALRHS